MSNFDLNQFEQSLDDIIASVGGDQTLQSIQIKTPEEQKRLEEAEKAAVRLTRTSAIAGMVDGALVFLCWVPLFVIGWIFQATLPGYNALVWSLVLLPLIILPIAFGIIVMIAPKEKDGWIPFFGVGFLIIGVIFGLLFVAKWVRSLLSLIACANAGWVAGAASPTIGIFGDNTAICGVDNRGLVITNFIFDCLAFIPVFAAVIVILMMISRKNRVALLLYKTKLGGIVNKIYEMKLLQKSGESTPEQNKMASLIGAKLRKNLDRAYKHGNVVHMLHRPVQSLIGHALGYGYQ